MADELILTADRWYQQVDGRLITHSKGDVLEVDQDTEEWLIRSGAARRGGAEPELVEEAAEPEVTAEPADESADGSEDDEPGPRGGLERPARSAGIAKWRDYAESKHNIKTSGMSKQDIIAAVTAAEEQ